MYLSVLFIFWVSKCVPNTKLDLKYNNCNCSAYMYFVNCLDARVVIYFCSVTAMQSCPAEASLIVKMVIASNGRFKPLGKFRQKITRNLHKTTLSLWMNIRVSGLEKNSPDTFRRGLKSCGYMSGTLFISKVLQSDQSHGIPRPLQLWPHSTGGRFFEVVKMSWN